MKIRYAILAIPLVAVGLWVAVPAGSSPRSVVLNTVPAAVPAPLPVAPAAPTPTADPTPVVVQSAPTVTTPAPVAVVGNQTSSCTIDHASLADLTIPNGPLSHDVSIAVTGRTTYPDGTLFVATVSVGGVQFGTFQNASARVDATGLIDAQGHYLGQESHQFWFEPVVKAPFTGPVVVRVTQGGTEVCSTSF